MALRKFYLSHNLCPKLNKQPKINLPIFTCIVWAGPTAPYESPAGETFRTSPSAGPPGPCLVPALPLQCCDGQKVHTCGAQRIGSRRLSSPSSNRCLQTTSLVTPSTVRSSLRPGSPAENTQLNPSVLW